MSQPSDRPPDCARRAHRAGWWLPAFGGAVAFGLVCPAQLPAPEAILASGRRLELRSVRLDPPTLIDEEAGTALRTDYIRELIFNPGPLPPLATAGLPAPPPGPAVALCTLFTTDGSVYQGRLVRIADRQLSFEPVGAGPLVLDLAGVQRVRFPEPRPWSRAGELAEIDDAELKRLFPQLLQLATAPATGSPAILSASRLLHLEGAGVVADRNRKVSLIPARPEVPDIETIDLPPGAQLRVHHALAVDPQGRLYHYLDGNLRREPLPGGGERCQLLPPHPEGAHLLSLDLGLFYASPRRAPVEHTFDLALGAEQTLEVELPPGSTISWAVPPGAPVEADMTDRTRPKWRCRAGASGGTAPPQVTLHLIPAASPEPSPRP